MIVEAQTNKWVYVGLHTILRLEEFSIVFSTLVFIKKKKPVAKPTMETGTNLSHISVMFSKSSQDVGSETHNEEDESSTKETEMESVQVDEEKDVEVPISN